MTPSTNVRLALLQMVRSLSCVCPTFNNHNKIVSFFWNILGAPGIRSRFAKLIVLVPPDMPNIVQGDYMVTTEGREIELECISHGGKPAAEVISILFYVFLCIKPRVSVVYCAPKQMHNNNLLWYRMFFNNDTRAYFCQIIKAGKQWQNRGQFIICIDLRLCVYINRPTVTYQLKNGIFFNKR